MAIPKALPILVAFLSLAAAARGAERPAAPSPDPVATELAAERSFWAGRLVDHDCPADRGAAADTGDSPSVAVDGDDEDSRDLLRRRSATCESAGRRH